MAHFNQHPTQRVAHQWNAQPSHQKLNRIVYLQNSHASQYQITPGNDVLNATDVIKVCEKNASLEMPNKGVSRTK
jgi:hypothetical protein